jgi:hypothetical protein
MKYPTPEVRNKLAESKKQEVVLDGMLKEYNSDTESQHSLFAIANADFQGCEEQIQSILNEHEKQDGN